jgi:hypothetical protein
MRLSPAQRAKCAQRGKPLTLGRLVTVFRAHGISLSIKETTCSATEKERADAALSDASNGGPTGLAISESVKKQQGIIVCSVFLNAPPRTHQVSLTKYATDVETYVSAWNISCAVYPSDRANEKRQVEQVRRAMVALAATL